MTDIDAACKRLGKPISSWYPGRPLTDVEADLATVIAAARSGSAAR